jgi:hypothetical protein
MTGTGASASWYVSQSANGTFSAGMPSASIVTSAADTASVSGRGVMFYFVVMAAVYAAAFMN